MRKSWLVCVLLGTVAWGQASPGTAPPPGPGAQGPGTVVTPKAAAPPDTAAAVPPDAPVLTVKGVCPAAPKAAVAKTGAAKPASTATKASPSDCKTVITKAEFEKLASGIAPNMTPQLRRQLVSVLPRLIAMSDAAKKKGLEKSPRYEETLKFAKMQILTNELQRNIQEEAAKVPPAEVEAYYKEHPEGYEQYNLDRLFVPRAKQPETEAKDADKEEKLTEEQQKTKEADDKNKEEQGEQEMTKLADTLRARAAAGEDFMKLQKEAFEAAGMKIESPTVNLPKLRRTGLPPAHAAVFDLKPGEVSQVISDSGGHYIYKVNSKEALPLDQVKDEIHNTLQSQRSKAAMDKYQNSFSVETNEKYFGPPGPAGTGMAPPRRIPNPHVAPGPVQPSSPSNQPPAAPQTPPPASKPD
ncbi:MAG TPA: peptidyl-prolyl cis-trans isomerase [Candidatus Sulfotelmatobacter sp.]